MVRVKAPARATGLGTRVESGCAGRTAKSVRKTSEERADGGTCLANRCETEPEVPARWESAPRRSPGGHAEYTSGEPGCVSAGSGLFRKHSRR